MSLALKPPAKTTEELQLIAASGVKGLTRAARAEIQRRRHEQLKQELGR